MEPTEPYRNHPQPMAPISAEMNTPQIYHKGIFLMCIVDGPNLEYAAWPMHWYSSWPVTFLRVQPIYNILLTSGLMTAGPGT